MFVSNCKREIEKSVARVSGGHGISSKTIKEEDKYTFPRCTLYVYSVQCECTEYSIQYYGKVFGPATSGGAPSSL